MSVWNHAKAKMKPKTIVKTKIYVYDDLTPSQAVYEIANERNINRFMDQWSQFDQMKFKRIIEVLKQYHQAIEEFVYNKLDLTKLGFLIKLKEAEAVDFVLNQFNIFSHEHYDFDVISPVVEQAKPIKRVSQADIKRQAIFSESQKIKAFHAQTNAFFEQKKIKNVFEEWKLHQLMVKKKPQNGHYMDDVKQVIRERQQKNRADFFVASLKSQAPGAVFKADGLTPPYWKNKKESK